MPHWKSMMDRDFIFAFDLNGRDVTVEISRVEAGSLTGQGGRKAKKPVVYFAGKEKGLALNATNCKTIASLYGNYTEKWIGKSITLYPTTTQMGGETMECIRIRPAVPKRGKSKPDDVAEQIRDEMKSTEMSSDEMAEIAQLEKDEVQ